MIRLSFLVRAVAVLLLMVPAAARAQHFEFGSDLVSGSERGRINGGYATARMDVVINGNQLTAILRNTSPDSENYGGNQDLYSPAITKFGFDLRDDNGDLVTVSQWELKGFDTSGNETTLGANDGTGNVWKMTKNDKTGDYRIKSKRSKRTAVAPLYNPATTAGYAAGDSYFTRAELTARFDKGVNLIESFASGFSPMVRFEYIGLSSSPMAKSMPGVRSAPEPASLAIWGVGLLAAIGYQCRKRRKNRKDMGTSPS